MNTKERLSTLLAESPLTEKEAEEFLSLLFYHDEAGLEEICELFEEDRSWITWLYENYRTKKAAFSSGDQQKIEQIYRDERADLEQNE